MKRLLKKYLALGLFALTASTSAFAAPAGGADFMHEFTGGTNSTISFFGGSTSFGIDVGYRYMLLPEHGIQVGYTTRLDYLSANDASTTNWTNFFAGRYNFQNDPSILNQYFLDAGLGFSLRKNSIASVSSSDTAFLFGAGLGKRFALSSNVAYSPQVSFEKVQDQDIRVNITLLAVSVFF